MKAPLMLKKFRLKNFKAVQDSGVVMFTPLTVFIGNNGSGKSSLIEGLETLHKVANFGLDWAMQEWHGFEYALNKGKKRRVVQPKPGDKISTRPALSHPMTFDMAAELQRQSVRYMLSVSAEAEGGQIYIQRETVIAGKTRTDRNDKGQVTQDGASLIRSSSDWLRPGESIIRRPLGMSDAGLVEWILKWQFLLLNPQKMGEPYPEQRTGGRVTLIKDGANVAEYMRQIYTLDQTAFAGIVETLQYVLSYARDLQTAKTSELERNVHLQMTEGDFKIPGWLLSTGTLRVVALLALLRHPEPPPLIVVEEIENGMDPRTLNLLVEEIRNAIEAGRTQIILTTHSPYLLDLLSLEHIVLAERVDGQPVFTRPADQKSLRKWAESFSPGKLYTMGRLSKGG